MPELIWLYLTALLYYQTSTSCVALADALATISHDRLTRLLQGDWSGQRLLDLVLPSYARHRLRRHPDFVLFDAWYPSRVILKRIRDDGWYVVCRLTKNRRFNGHALRHHRRHPYWAECGRLNGGLKVLAVRYGSSTTPPSA